MISFEEYCSEYFDLHLSLMTEEQIKEAKKTYQSEVKADQKHQKALAKAKESRKLAKFYGGKALTGSAKQKSWAEDIRNSVLESESLSVEQKQELVTLGGFTDTAKFWIENRHVSAISMNPENILAQYRGLKEIEAKHRNTLARSGPAFEKDAARKEIADYIKSCDFEFESAWL